MSKFSAACVQLNSQNDVDENICKATDLICQAAEKADLIALPENAFLMPESKEELRAKSPLMSAHPAILQMQKLAQQQSKWLLLGSVVVALEGTDRFANRCVVINPQGKIVASYDKIHLFDVDIEGGESHRESERFAAGKEQVIVDTDLGKIGLSICYDLRFPQQYREMAQQSAVVMSIPAAFTYKTGEAHWEILLRARAIECGAFVIAPAMCGEHLFGRRTWGHSMIIDPWGEILAEQPEGEGFITAEIDTDYAVKIRKMIPTL